jgi:tetratricopeptide (TPR) repeat protein
MSKDMMTNMIVPKLGRPARSRLCSGLLMLVLASCFVAGIGDARAQQADQDRRLSENDVRLCHESWKDSAEEACNRVLARSSGNRLLLATALAGRARIARQNRQFEKSNVDLANAEIAARSVKIATKKLPDYFVKALFDIGRMRLDEKKFDIAIDHFSRVIRIDRDHNHDRVFMFRAWAHSNKGDHSSAIQDFTKYIDLNPDEAWGYTERGNAFLHSGNPDQAVRDYSKAISVNQDAVGAHPGRSAAFEQVGELEPALADAIRWRELVPSDTAAQAAIGRLRTAIAARQSSSSPPQTLSQPLAVAPAIAAGRRIALVIGNSSYERAPRLNNPERDAEAMARLFRQAGFAEVRVQTNLGVGAMRRALRDFSVLAADADIAVVFFAGHGIEIDGRNFLLPTDVTLARDVDAPDEAVELDRVLELLEPARRLKLVILDACRENPFASKMQRRPGGRSIGRGLGAPAPQSSNTLVAYAARAGAIAADGEGQNSPFTSALLRHLAKPGLDIRIALGEVHDAVMADSRQRQQPFLYGALGGGTLALAP